MNSRSECITRGFVDGLPNVRYIDSKQKNYDFNSQLILESDNCQRKLITYLFFITVLWKESASWTFVNCDSKKHFERSTEEGSLSDTIKTTIIYTFKYQTQVKFALTLPNVSDKKMFTCSKILSLHLDRRCLVQCLYLHDHGQMDHRHFHHLLAISLLKVKQI